MRELFEQEYRKHEKSLFLVAVAYLHNTEDAKDVFGIEAEATDIYGGTLNHEGYKSVARQLAHTGTRRSLM